MYYEVTSDSLKGFYYLDAYKQFENRQIPTFKIRGVCAK